MTGSQDSEAINIQRWCLRLVRYEKFGLLVGLRGWGLKKGFVIFPTPLKATLALIKCSL